MRIIESIDEMRAEAADMLARRCSCGLVPTKGSLHEGSLSLVRRARDENDAVAVSAFVNPSPFAPGEEFPDGADAPDARGRDAELAEREGADILFRPAAEEMYSPRAQTFVQVSGLTRGLCGVMRGQGHFRSVATAAAKLFNIVRPARAYFGQKNAQQALAVQRMVIDLNFPVEIAVCPTVREEDGLAASARNRFIPAGLREHATALRRALVAGRELLREGQKDAFSLANAMQERILGEGGCGCGHDHDGAVELEYLDIVSPETLEEAETVDDLVLVAGAITVGGVRLIDNILVGPDGPWAD